MTTKKKKPLLNTEQVTEVALKKWDNIYYIRAYQLARMGLANMAIAKSLGVAWTTFKNWMDKRPTLVKALEMARGEDKEDEASGGVVSFMYKRLSPEMKEVWDKIIGDPDNTDVLAEADKYLTSRGKRARQELFMHACIHYNFNLSEAGRVSGVPKGLYDNWFRHDKEFQKLMKELKWHRKNLLDGAFWKGVESGETALILHGQKTLNADRGFASKKEIDIKISGKVEHQHSVTLEMVMDRLEIPQKKAVLQAIRAIEAEHKADSTDLDEILDAEIIGD